MLNTGPMVRHVPTQFVIHWIHKESVDFPSSVDTICPHCKRKVNYSIQWGSPKNYVVEYSQTHCPACQKEVTFIFLLRRTNNSYAYQGQLFINPGDEVRQPLVGIEDTEGVNEGIKKAYLSTVNVLNAQEWTATSVLCRRVLEGITKSIIPEEHRDKPLAAQIKELPSHIDLSEPIKTLADAIRKGGNLGAHFDLEKEPNEEISSLMVDLLDDLIEYIFILPGRIQSLHDKIEGLSNL